MRTYVNLVRSWAICHVCHLNSWCHRGFSLFPWPWFCLPFDFGLPPCSFKSERAVRCSVSVLQPCRCGGKVWGPGAFCNLLIESLSSGASVFPGCDLHKSFFLYSFFNPLSETGRLENVSERNALSPWLWGQVLVESFPLDSGPLLWRRLWVCFTTGRTSPSLCQSQEQMSLGPQIPGARSLNSVHRWVQEKSLIFSLSSFFLL